MFTWNGYCISTQTDNSTGNHLPCASDVPELDIQTSSSLFAYTVITTVSGFIPWPAAKDTFMIYPYAENQIIIRVDLKYLQDMQTVTTNRSSSSSSSDDNVVVSPAVSASSTSKIIVVDTVQFFHFYWLSRLVDKQPRMPSNVNERHICCWNEENNERRLPCDS